MRIAVKIGYIGEGFFGYQRQTDKRTIEGCLVDALTNAGLLADPKTSRFASAGRTDRGVNALGQVIAFDILEPTKGVCYRLNQRLPGEVFAWAYAEVVSDFDPRRHVESKTYLYILHDDGMCASDLMGYAHLFEGEHDFSQFCRGSERNPIRSIDEIRVLEGNPTKIFFTARGFLWTQVRRIVSAITLLARNKMEEDLVLKALNGSAELSLSSAPAENLILWDVRYRDVEFKVEEGCLASAKEFLENSIRGLERGLSARRNILDGLLENAPVA